MSDENVVITLNLDTNSAACIVNGLEALNQKGVSLSDSANIINLRNKIIELLRKVSEANEAEDNGEIKTED